MTRQVLLFSTSACDELTPSLHRTSLDPHLGRSLASGVTLIPGKPSIPGFDVKVDLFRCVSNGSLMFVFSSPT
ncbi:MAG: hypothetical protein M0Z45_01600 [Actinomycetota bacterium]|nr:hypothetical protein [Actinomycetota bacterium]